MKRIVKSAITAYLLIGTVHAETFTLGQVNITHEVMEQNPFEQSIDQEDIKRDSAVTVSQTLDNISGLNSSVLGGRGEGTLFIRGFDARRIGVFIDGIPVYVPYDGNFDYNRFLTTDISQIDISKGYSSIAYGANTMGGVINIVSKRPTKEFQGDIKGTLYLDDTASLARYITSFNVGSLVNNYYVQLSGNYAKQNHYRLSDSYEATSEQPKGDRLRSKSEDKKISIKAGYVFDDSSEIAIGYSNQQGQKQQPPATDLDYSRSKYWDWPYWDKETIFINGQKNFESSYLKASVYYDKLENSLYSYDDDTYTTMEKRYAFKSRYDDYTYGARLEYGLSLDKNLITLSANYKKDVHRGYDISTTDSSESLTEKYKDETYSFGIEDEFSLSESLTLFGGVSYDTKSGKYAWDESSSIEEIELGTNHTFNPQIALVYGWDSTNKLRASISRKTYLTSMKDRYSRKLGRNVPNPDLDSEVATHYELSYQKSVNNLMGSANVYYTQVDDTIQSVLYDTSSGLYQNQNIGKFAHTGLEIDLKYKQESFEVGGNYAYVHVKNKDDSDVKLTRVPKNQLFVYAQIDLGKDFGLYANVKYRNGAYEQKMDNSYEKISSFTTADIKLSYQAIESLLFEVGVKNITDKNYAYSTAFPMAGREYFASLGYKF